MCGSIVDIQSLTAEIRRGNKKRRRRKKQDENIMVCPIPQGDHNKPLRYLTWNASIKSISLTVA